MAQPYAHSDTARIAGYAEHFGCELLGATGWGSAFNRIGAIPQHAAVEMGRKLMKEHPDADSIFLPSPHWPTAGAIDVLEKEFGVNVMTAHQAIVWDALRRCGVNDKIQGFGRLFREFCFRIPACSPHGAQRNAGRSIPDFASLHPGYSDNNQETQLEERQ